MVKIKKKKKLVNILFNIMTQIKVPQAAPASEGPILTRFSV